jgi:hypothetical protein
MQQRHPEGPVCVTTNLSFISSPCFVPFFAGAMSGVASALVGQPFDTIKVRMQTSFRFPSGNVPSGPVDCLKMTVSALFVSMCGCACVRFSGRATARDRGMAGSSGDNLENVSSAFQVTC